LDLFWKQSFLILKKNVLFLKGMEKKFKSQNFDQLIFGAKILAQIVAQIVAQILVQTLAQTLAQILVLYNIGRPSYGCMKV
jgi:hypothetical protein